MILTCPNCGTQYAVKDGAIPALGRQVRCAACKHSWHQDPDGSGEPLADTEQPQDELQPEQPQVEAPGDELPVPEDAAEESIAEAALIEPRSGPEAEQRAYEEAVISGEANEPKLETSPLPPASHEAPPAPEYAPAVDWDAPPEPEAQDDQFSPFADREDEAEPRRRSRSLPLLLLIAVIAALAALFWFVAPPEWKARVGLVSANTSPLALVTTHMDRQRLESGNELLTVTGRVINPTSEDQAVPPLQAQLRSSSGQIVYSWTIAPPARSLSPGASASFNSAEVNVPPGGDELTITVGAPKA